MIAVESSRTDPDDDVVDVTALSALDVVEVNKSHYRCRRLYRRYGTSSQTKHDDDEQR